MTVHRTLRAGADRNLFKIETKALALASQMRAASKAHDKAEQTMFAWRKRNPRPLKVRSQKGERKGACSIRKGDRHMDTSRAKSPKGVPL